MGRKRASTSTSTSREAAEEPEMAVASTNAVDGQVQSQSASILAESFATSAAFFGKKVSYAPTGETPAEGATTGKSIERKGDTKGTYESGKGKTMKEERKKEGTMKGEEVKDADKKKEKKKRKKEKKRKVQEVEEKDALQTKKERESGGVDTQDRNNGEDKVEATGEKATSEEGDRETEEEQKGKKVDDEKARRTVFVGNVSLEAAPKAIKKHFSACGEVESVRLRYLPVAGCAVDQAGNQKLMMKVCAIKKILTKAKDTCNAYVTFVEEGSVEAALKLNGTTFAQKQIRVDRSEVAYDARRSVFVGNVPFKCTDEQMLQFFLRRLRTKEEPAPIENVRLVRDRESGFGKGFGYLLLKNQALVAKTLTLRDLKMERCELRVQVCGKRFKNMRGEETVKQKYEGLRSSASARARIQLKRKANAGDHDRGLLTKKVKRAAEAAGLGKKLKPKHAARKAAKAAAEAAAAAADRDSTKKRKHDRNDRNDRKAEPNAKKPKHAARKAKLAAAAKQ